MDYIKQDIKVQKGDIGSGPRRRFTVTGIEMIKHLTSQVRYLRRRWAGRLTGTAAFRAAGVLLVVAAVSFGQGQFTEFPIPTPGGAPSGIARGPDGNLWFTEQSGNKIGRITPAGVITEFSVPTAGAGPFYIASGPDGNLWFTEAFGGKVGRITPAGVITEFPVPAAGAPLGGIASGPDGNLWFTEPFGNQIGRMTPAGVVTEFPVPTAPFPYGPSPSEIASGPDGNLWFTQLVGGIGRITPAGAVTEFAVPSTGVGWYTAGIVSGPDGSLWFVEGTAGKIGRMTTAGATSEFPVSGSGTQGIANGPDGNVWFVEAYAGRIGRISPAGAITEFKLWDPPVPTPGFPSSPYTDVPAIVSGPDGNLWFTEDMANKIGRFVPPLPPSVPTPTLSEWGLALCGILLAAVAARTLLGRRQENAS